MLRLPPTVIGLARSDIQDHDNRRQLGRCKEKDLIKKALKNIVAPTPRNLTLAYRPLPQNAIDPVNLQSPHSKRCQLPTGGKSLVPSLTQDFLHSHHPTENDCYTTGSIDCLAEDLSQDLSSKKDLYMIIKLTSHIVTYDINYRPYGLQSSQTSERAKERSIQVPRNYLNSSSLDSAEYTSVAYEHERNLSNSTCDLLFSSTNLIGFHEELRRNSLQSSRVLIATSVALQDPPNEQSSRQISELKNVIHPPSQSLPIMPKRVSKVRSMPSTPQPIHPEEDFMGFTYDSGPNNCNEIPTKSFNRRLVTPVLSAHNSPEQRLSSDNETFTMNRTFLQPKIPSGSYQVYNDEMPPELQPETPANLPESRHRSRYHPSFTAPDLQYCRRHHPAEFLNGSETIDLSPVTSRVGSSRNTITTELSLHNFDSFYGRRGDNRQKWIEDLRLSGTHVRLWRSDYTENDNDDRIF